MKNLSYLYPHTARATTETPEMTEYCDWVKWSFRTFCFAVLSPDPVLPESGRLVWYLKLLLVFSSNLLLLCNHVFSVFQTDIQFSVRPFWFQKFAPMWERDFQKDVFAVGKNSIFIAGRWKVKTEGEKNSEAENFSLHASIQLFPEHFLLRRKWETSASLRYPLY